MLAAILIILILALTLYAVLGGADFGAGVWEFNTALRAGKREREMLHHAIGPVWETNHVWLIFVIVILFGAFPPAFASMNQALFMPLFLGLIGIVFRGAAYAFRSQLKSDERRQRQASFWIAVFALASVLAPFCLGASVGAIASGELAYDEHGDFTGNQFVGWINPLSVFTGFFTVGLCAYCTAVYMIRETRQSAPDDADMLELWVTRAWRIGWVMGSMAIAGLVLIAIRYPHLTSGFRERGWPLILLSVGAGLVSLIAIRNRQPNVAALGASLTSGSVVIGWGVAQYPDLIPGVWTVQQAAAPTGVLQSILIATVAGAILLAPSMWLLFKIFKMPNQSNG